MFTNKSLFIGFMIFLMARSFSFAHDLAYFILAAAGIVISLISVITLSFSGKPSEKCSRILYFKAGLILFVFYMFLSLTSYDALAFLISFLSVCSLILSIFLEKGEMQNVSVNKDKRLVKKLLVIWVINVFLILLISIISEALDVELLVYVIYCLVFFALAIWIYPIGKILLNVLRY